MARRKKSKFRRVPKDKPVPKPEVKLTGYYKLSGFIASLREDTRICNTVAEINPEELTEVFVNDLISVSEELRMVSEYVESRFLKKEKPQATE